MEKKVVLAELDYIFNIVKGSFYPQALAKYLTAAGAWNKYVAEKAKSYGINLDPSYNVETAVKNKVKQKIDNFESERELVEDWVMAYLFLPEALQEFDSDDETYKWRKNKKITSIFESFLKKEEERTEDQKDSNFAGWVDKAISGTINKYLKQEERSNAPFLTEENESGVKQVMDKDLKEKPLRDREMKVKRKEYMEKHKVDEVKDDKGEIFGITPGDMDKIQGISDFRDNIMYEDLKKAIVSYVKTNAKPEVYKVMQLKLADPDLSFEDIAEKMKKNSKGTIAVYFEDLAKVIMQFARDKGENTDLEHWLKKLTTYFRNDRSVEEPKEKKHKNTPQEAVKLEKDIENQNKLIEDLESSLRDEKNPEDKQGIKDRIKEETLEKTKLLRKRSYISSINSFILDLEDLVKNATSKNATKIASIKSYIDTLCDRIS